VVKVNTPVAGATMRPEYVKAIGRMAYVWGWPPIFLGRQGQT